MVFKTPAFIKDGSNQVIKSTFFSKKVQIGLFNPFNTSTLISAILLMYTHALPELCFPKSFNNCSRSVSPVAETSLTFLLHPLSL